MPLIIRGIADCRKTYITFKNGVWGAAPSGVRAAAPHSPPFPGKGGRGIGIINQKLISKKTFLQYEI